MSSDLMLREIEGEPRILDTDLGTKLGFDRPRDVRKIIERNIEKLNKISRCATVARRPENGGREFTEYYLDQKQAIFICMKSETDTAVDVQLDIVRVYDDYLRGQQEPIAPAKPEPIAPQIDKALSIGAYMQRYLTRGCTPEQAIDFANFGMQAYLEGTQAINHPQSEKRHFRLCAAK